MAGPGNPPGVGWMEMPRALPNCPRGLEYLTTIDQILVHQEIELLEAIFGFETANKYSILNSIGQRVYYAVEVSDCLVRTFCGPTRPFGMKILDNFQNEVIHMNRPLACTGCCFPCCLQSLEVSSPPGTIIGYVQQQWSIFRPKFTIRNAGGDIIYRIEGPLCQFKCCCADVIFKITTKDGVRVGEIRKKWAGCVQENFTDADNFSITFPMDLDVKIKTVLMGASFLIDYMYFEK